MHTRNRVQEWWPANAALNREEEEDQSAAAPPAEGCYLGFAASSIAQRAQLSNPAMALAPR